MAARALSVWVEEHTRTVVRNNKLMTLMMVWDKRVLLHSFEAWLLALEGRQRLRSSIAAITTRHMLATAREALAGWGAAAHWSRVTQSQVCWCSGVVVWWCDGVMV